MEKNNRIFVGMLIMTRLKLSENSPEELVAILQRRGKINTDNEQGFKMQSFPGLCEITSYGKASENETPEVALKREMTEELGTNATKIINDSKYIKIYEKTEIDGDNIFVWTTFCDKEILKEIRLDISTGGVEILRRADLKNANFADFSQKGLKVTDLNNITIFETPISIIEKAFDTFE